MTVLICFCLALTASEDGNFSGGSFGEDLQSNSPAAVFDVNELNRWSIPSGTQALGLDYMGYWYTSNTVGYVSNLDDTVFWMNSNTGAATGTPWTTAANNGLPFGLARIPIPADDDEIHVNDWGYDAIFYKEYDTSWTEYNALCDNMGRGMDYCESEDKIFEFYTVTDPGNFRWYVAMYTPGSSAGGSYQLDCNVSADWAGSGVALFSKYGGGVNIAVTMYNSSWIRFFEYPGHSGEMYYGYCVLPYSAEMVSSFGLTYADDLDCFFHSWKDASNNYYISKLEVLTVSLEQSTWGAIKSGF